MASLLVTGGGGFVGRHVLPALIDGGHQVRALVRDEQRTAGVVARLDVRQQRAMTFAIGDVGDPTSLHRAAAGMDAIVHLVAIPRDRTGGRDLMRVNFDGTRNMLDAARDAGVGRFVHLGALGVTDDPNLHYARSKARAEAAVRESGRTWTILKPSLLWGPGDGFFNILASLVRWSPGVVPIPARQTARFQPLSVDDLARIVARCVDDESTAGRAFELGGPDLWTYREMVVEVARAMGKRRVLVPLPLPLIALVARSAELAHLPFPVASDQLRQMALRNATQIDAVRSAFGFEPRPMSGNLGYLRAPRAQQEAAAAR